MADDLDITLGALPPPAPAAPISVTLDGGAEEEDRYSRLRLIPWWDQERLRTSRVMVVGAGALGNEILKNMALLGIGYVFLVDMDRVENSNLSRSVLYRARDEGQLKAEAAARAAMDINPDTHVHAYAGNVIHDVGLGVFRAVDVVIGGLDNREARLWVNQCCWRLTRPFVDGAIEVLNGMARVFVPPDGACYECTMNEADYRMLAQRRSCALLSRDQMLEGKVPTTPTTGSVIAGIECQEALKLLHGRADLPTLEGKGFFFNGATHDSFTVTYRRKPDCLSHETWGHIQETDWTASGTTLRTCLDRARADLGPEAALGFVREIVTAFRCAACGTAEPVFRALGRLTEREARCPTCGESRAYESTHMVTGDEAYLDCTLAEVGIPKFDILTAHSGLEERFYELSGDRAAVMGD
ncbi:MAG TPA: ThiF family adenylyltransferase [Armatimonadota bacterium]|jgi:adenylyltransferase/sulfurtransferase